MPLEDRGCVDENTREEDLIPDTEPKRVKAYVLENNEWKDTGTGFCIGKLDKEDEGRVTSAYLVVTNEDEPREVLLRSKLEGNIEYQRQEETLIVWKDLNGRDIALSFEESLGCDVLCEFIVEVQRHSETNISLVAVKSNDNGVGSVHEIITGPVSLPSVDPEQNEQTLMGSLKILNENLAFEFLKNETIEFILKSDYVGLLISHFHKAEAARLPKDLFLLGSIVKTLILYNQRDVLEKMIEDDYIMGILGILEYDTEFPDSKTNHRKCLESNSPSIKEVIPIQNEELKNILKKCFRLQFLKDAVLVRFLDDHNISFILDIILDLQTCIIDFIRVDPFLDTLFALYDERPPEEVDADLIEKRKDGLRLLHQCVQMSKNLDAADKETFYRTLVGKDIFKVLDYAFHKETESALRILATDTIITIIEYDVLLIPNVQRLKPSSKNSDKEAKIENVDQQAKPEGSEISLLLILSAILLTDKSPGMREQVSQALHTLLHPDGCLENDLALQNNHSGNADLISDMNYDMQSDSENTNGFNSSSSHVMESFGSFYSQVAPVLFQPLIKDPEDKNKLIDDDNLLIHSVKLVSLVCTEHNRRISREFILENGIVESLSHLIEPTHSMQLRLTAVRCFKNIMCLDDDYYHRHMISKKLYRPIFKLLEENLDKDNLANSCVQDFCKIVLVHCLSTRTEGNGKQQEMLRSKLNFMLLSKHIMEEYGDILQRAKHILVFNEMIEFNQEQRVTEVDGLDDREDITMDSDVNESAHLTLDDESKVFKRLHSEVNDVESSFDATTMHTKKIIDKLSTVDPPSAMLGKLMRE